MRLGFIDCVEEGKMSDLDSHADCCVCGKEVLVFNDFDREVTVTGWDLEGWHLCVEWKDGTTIWERLVDLKESNPVEVDEYAVAKSLIDAPAFVWWSPRCLKNRSRIIAAVTKHYHKRTHKFGIEVPKIVDDCVRLDKENDNTIWKDAVRK
jgi:hypothetical protein